MLVPLPRGRRHKHAERKSQGDDYALLWSVKEYKKTRVRYFTDEWDDWRRADVTPAGM